jgi:hypothetical protein
MEGALKQNPKQRSQLKISNAKRAKRPRPVWQLPHQIRMGIVVLRGAFPTGILTGEVLTVGFLTGCSRVLIIFPSVPPSLNLVDVDGVFYVL